MCEYECDLKIIFSFLLLLNFNNFNLDNLHIEKKTASIMMHCYMNMKY